MALQSQHPTKRSTTIFKFWKLCSVQVSSKGPVSISCPGAPASLSAALSLGKYNNDLYYINFGHVRCNFYLQHDGTVLGVAQNVNRAFEALHIIRFILKVFFTSEVLCEMHFSPKKSRPLLPKILLFSRKAHQKSVQVSLFCKQCRTLFERVKCPSVLWIWCDFIEVNFELLAVIPLRSFPQKVLLLGNHQKK